jgi:hypothetical protein
MLKVVYLIGFIGARNQQRWPDCRIKPVMLQFFKLPSVSFWQVVIATCQILCKLKGMGKGNVAANS